MSATLTHNISRQLLSSSLFSLSLSPLLCISKHIHHPTTPVYTHPTPLALTTHSHSPHPAGPHNTPTLTPPRWPSQHAHTHPTPLALTTHPHSPHPAGAHNTPTLTDSGFFTNTFVLPSCHWSGSMLTAVIKWRMPSTVLPCQCHVSSVRMA